MKSLTRAYHTRVTYRYLCSLPDGYDAQPERRWPMVLWLHGGGRENPESLSRSIASLVAQPALVVAPICPLPPDGVDCRYVNWDFHTLGDLVRQVSDTYRVDPHRRAVVGFSMGGSGAWELPFYEPELFTKVVVMAGVCHPWSLIHYPRAAVWCFIGEHDGLREAQEHTVHMARKFNVDVIQTLWPDTDHSGVCRRTLAHRPMLAWLTEDADLRATTASTSADNRALDIRQEPH
jgi:predicted peptidase